MIYGYARVSTDGQSVDAQVRQLKAAGVRQVLRQVASGAKTDRSQLRTVLAQLDAGDVLMVTRLDRLTRSTRDLLNTLAVIAGKKAGVKKQKFLIISQFQFCGLIADGQGNDWPNANRSANP